MLNIIKNSGKENAKPSISVRTEDIYIEITGNPKTGIQLWREFIEGSPTFRGIVNRFAPEEMIAAARHGGYSEEEIADLEKSLAAEFADPEKPKE